ncbi:MAG: outer membrane protein assembly factor BamD, partial [Beijerinckiaceae bacterium]|nr:outer membrane protein assembly factor BamD [Beijerinckiaceae bacterium]
RYPNTRYAADARLKIDLVRDHLAGKEMEIGRFYETRGQWLAATMRFRKVVDDYQTTTHAPEALMRLTETYLALGVPDEARKAAAVLGANYPGTQWYSRAYKLSEEHPPVAVAAIAPGQLIVLPADKALPDKPIKTREPKRDARALPPTGGSSTNPGNPNPGS